MEKSFETCAHGSECIVRVCHHCINFKRKQPNKPIEPVKVVIPKEVAEAIEVIKMNSRDIHFMYFTNWDWMKERYKSLFHVLSSYFQHNPHEYIRAIQEGYQVEKTPREQVLELLFIARKNTEILAQDNPARSHYCGKVQALEQVIKIMGWED